MKAASGFCSADGSPYLLMSLGPSSSLDPEYFQYLKIHTNKPLEVDRNLFSFFWFLDIDKQHN